MSGSATVAGSKRTNAAASAVTAPAAAAATASASRVTTRSQARAMANQPPTPASIASFFALRPTAPDTAAAAPASSSSAVAAAAAAAAPVPAATAAAASSPPSRRSTVPLRRADPPSLFSANSPDPLSLILSFVLIDLPIATGQPYFPKELVRIVHEYASEACFIVQLESTDDDDLEITQDVSCSSSKLLLQRLGAHLPSELSPYIAMGCDVSDEVSSLVEEPSFHSYCDCCLLDEKIQMESDEEISLLLHAQLADHEYRECSGEVELDHNGELVDPAQRAHKPIHFCSDAITKRVAAIVARGQEPVAVELDKLLERLRSSLKAGRLPRGLSPRPCDWAPLFEWIRTFEVQLNEIKLDWWESESYPQPRAEPVLSAVLVRSTTEGSPVSIQGEACLWSHDQSPRRINKPAASMMIAEDEDDDGGQPQPLPQSSARSSGSASSASAAASSAPRVSSLNADEESAARAAPRQRR